MTRRRHVHVATRYPTIRENGARLCSYCRAPLTGRLMRWCSERCLYEAWRRTSPQIAATMLVKERGLRCEQCGLEFGELADAIDLLRQQHGEAVQSFVRDLLATMARRGWRTYDRWYDHLWECHHIVRHAEGGDLEPSNLRVLCVPCHKTTLARAKRGDAPLFGGKETL